MGLRLPGLHLRLLLRRLRGRLRGTGRRRGHHPGRRRRGRQATSRAPASGPQQTLPKADAWRDLATALQQDGRSEEAIAAARALRRPRAEGCRGARDPRKPLPRPRRRPPRRSCAWRRRGRRAGQPRSVLRTSVGSPRSGRHSGPNPVTDVLSGESNARVNDLYTRTTQAYQEAKLKVRNSLPTSSRKTRASRSSSRKAAENAGDYPSAIAAYKKFLTLAPDDPSAAAVEARRSSSSKRPLRPPPHRPAVRLTRRQHRVQSAQSQGER